MEKSTEKAGETVDQLFTQFAKFGDTSADGKSINLTKIDKWLKQAGIIDKKITTTDTGICFNKFKSRTIDCATFHKFLDELAKYKKVDVAELEKKLMAGGTPGTNKATEAVNVGGVDRLTDTSKYTGSHKERFDAQGKGKGIEGRSDVADDSGYVKNYKGKDTYDKTH